MSLKGSSRNFGAPLVGVCVAVLVSVPISAFLAGAVGDTYEARVAVYGGLLLWIIAGAVSVFFISKDSKRCNLSLRWFFLWFISAWLWPIPLAMHLRRSRLNQKKPTDFS